MARWKRRLITEAVIGLLLLYMYVQLERLGWSRHAILIALGGFAVACGLISFAAKPNEKFAEMTGQYEGRTLVVYNMAWIVLGSALLAWAFLVN